MIPSGPIAAAAPDLRTRPPRRWNATVDGIIWLPRLIDKARAHDAGTLGNYLFGQSPVDSNCLRTAGIDYATLLEITRDAGDDAGVLAAIEGHAPGARERLRAWSGNPPLVCRATFPLVDADEGHGRGILRVFSLIPQSVFGVAVLLLRRLRPFAPIEYSGREDVGFADANASAMKWRMAIGTASVAVAAVGAVAVGARAIGALAVGALAIARFGVGRARFERLEIDELIVRKLTIVERTSAEEPPAA